MFAGLRGAVARFFGGEGMFLAAGLAFAFLVCLIPLTLIAVAVIGFVLSTERAAQEVVAQVAGNFPVYKAELTRVLLRIVETRRTSGALGTVILVVFTMPVFGSVRLVLHRMLGMRPRGYLRSLVSDAGMALLVGPLLFGALVVTWVVQWFQGMAVHVAGMPVQWVRTGTLALGFGLSVTILYLAYRYVPDRRIRVGPSLAGAVLAGVLWEIAKQLFRLYIQKVNIYGQLYGPLGVLVALVMFVYYTAVVFVLGAAYVAALDGRRR